MFRGLQGTGGFQPAHGTKAYISDRGLRTGGPLKAGIYRKTTLPRMSTHSAFHPSATTVGTRHMGRVGMAAEHDL